MRYTPFSTRRAGCRAVLLALFILLSAAAPAHAAALPDALVPIGVTAGIRLPTDGVTVSGLTGVETAAGNVYPARDAGLMAGDRLLEANGRPVRSAEELQKAVSGGDALTLTIRRGDETKEIRVTPAKGREGYRIGVWVRDSMLGIGTLTYYNPKDGGFGALGHGITDDAGGERLLSISGGSIVPSYVTDVRPGKSGEPGELHGRFEPSKVLGTVDKNTEGGIFGRMSASPAAQNAVPCLPAGEVRTGDAQILACVDGETARTYHIRILKLYPDDENLRNLLIEVTDAALLAKTGGIVQGMSGSPILQDGKLVGAVTHVLVNDPTRGYGIFIENMLDAAG
ncbi:MAG: SpoIVB peptidase [Clostridiaceae bacterium]|nr:SpoIVB peptidase [Clostridiaceae bacterium]